MPAGLLWFLTNTAERSNSITSFPLTQSDADHFAVKRFLIKTNYTHFLYDVSQLGFGYNGLLLALIIFLVKALGNDKAS